MNKKKLPETLDEVVTLLYNQMDKDDKIYLKELKEDQLIQLHNGYGRYIRNTLGLWSGNPKLKRNLNLHHPDDCSSLIIKTLWNKIQKE